MNKKSGNFHRKTHSSSIDKYKIMNKSIDTTQEKRYITETNFIDTSTEFNKIESSSDLEVLKHNSKNEKQRNISKSARPVLNKRNKTNELENNGEQSLLNEKEIKQKIEILLKKQIKCLKIYIILQFIVCINDFLCIWIFPKNFLNIFNIISLFLLLILDCYMYIQFHLGAKEVNIKFYKYIKKIKKLVFIDLGIFFFNMIYEIVVQMIINNFIEFDSNQIFKWIIFILFYVIENISFPVLIVMELTDIKKNIKNIRKLNEKDNSLISSNYGNSNTEEYSINKKK